MRVYSDEDLGRLHPGAGLDDVVVHTEEGPQLSLGAQGSDMTTGLSGLGPAAHGSRAAWNCDDKETPWPSAG
jgi:hypothetical protein